MRNIFKYSKLSMSITIDSDILLYLINKLTQFTIFENNPNNNDNFMQEKAFKYILSFIKSFNSKRFIRRS